MCDAEKARPIKKELKKALRDTSFSSYVPEEFVQLPIQKTL